MHHPYRRLRSRGWSRRRLPYRSLGATGFRRWSDRFGHASHNDIGCRGIEEERVPAVRGRLTSRRKDVRDRAMAIELYARKKAGGLVAAQAAGRVVTEATLRLAQLYAEE